MQGGLLSIIQYVLNVLCKDAYFILLFKWMSDVQTCFWICYTEPA